MAGVSQEARLLALTCVLLASPIGLTRAEIFASVPGYDDDSTATLRKFERDKNVLRDLGFDLETIGDYLDPENLNEARYRVSRTSFEWPDGFRISKRQLQYLELAAKSWSSGEMNRAANFAVTRLRALGLGAAQDVSTIVHTRLVSNDPAFSALSVLISEQQVAEFKYRKADGNESHRTVSPWNIRSIGGQFVLLAHDHGDGTTKNFLVRRIVGRVQAASDNYVTGNDKETRLAEKDLTAYILQNVASLRVAPNTEAWVHFGIESSDGDSLQPVEIQVNYMDLELLIEELIEFGSAVEVLAPERLRSAMFDHAKKVLDSHA